MKKNIIIVLLLLTNITSGVYAYLNKLEADKSRESSMEHKLMAEQQRMFAIQNERKAIESAHEAVRQRSEAERQRILAMDQLAKYQKKK